MRLTTTDLVRAINDLPKNRQYRYINPRNKRVIQIRDITLPEGPIVIRRYDPSKGERPADANDESISPQMIARIANAFLPGQPINFDRVLGGSYNTRSALEALLAHTPQFYTCNPGRLDSYSGNVARGHKHLMWLPDEPHQLGMIQQKETELVISEAPIVDLTYDSLAIPDDKLKAEIDENIQRQHARIQVALVLIGQCLGYRSWVAHNDKGIIYKGQRLGEMETVIESLRDEPLVASFDNAANAGWLIDCIWFGNQTRMPAVMEVEHTTGVTSGLTRMAGFKQRMPQLMTRYVIVAPDEDRRKVVTECSRPQFADLDARFFPYSAVEELLLLCQRRSLQGGTTDTFLDAYIEAIRGQN